MKMAILISALMTAGPAFAEPMTSQPATQDGVAASFERMLAYRPTTLAKPFVREQDDPLVSHLAAALWGAGPKFHTLGASDQVRASFDRMLTERSPVLPAPVARNDNDPLRSHISAVLWDLQPTQCTFIGHGASSQALAALD